MHTHVERIIPGTVTIATFEEHEARYQFAGAFVKGKRVLDLACGAGIGTSYLLRAGARSCTGVDVSQEAVNFASEHYPGPRFLLGDGLNIPLGDESVDVVVSFETMEHVSDQSRFLAECYRVLIPGGVFVGSTPHDPVLRWIDPGNPFHLHEFSVQKMAELLSAKFRDIHLFAQSPVVYPVTVAKQLCVRVLNLLRLTEPVLRMMGKSSLVAICARREYNLGGKPSKIMPYSPSWVRQPTVTVAMATK
jgi:SAM-dependent methyltransferase